MSDTQMMDIAPLRGLAAGGLDAPAQGSATLIARLDPRGAGRLIDVGDTFAAVSGSQGRQWSLAELIEAAVGDHSRAAGVIASLARNETVQVTVGPDRLAAGSPVLRARLNPVDLDELGAPTHVVCAVASDTPESPGRVSVGVTRQLDPLTGLLDRAGLLERLKAVCAGATAEHPVSVLFVDVDHFKLINDSLGHEAGDGVLLEVAAA